MIWLDLLLGSLLGRTGRYAPNSLGDNYIKIYRATVRKRRVRAVLGTQEILFCPHLLGLRDAEPYVLGFEIQEEWMWGSGARNRWRWIRVADLREVRIQAGAWLTGVLPVPPLDGFEVQIKAA